LRCSSLAACRYGTKPIRFYDICSHLQAVKYDEWAQTYQLAPPSRYESLAKNGWTELVPARIADAQRRGVACFDRHFYVNANQFDLGFIEAQPDPQVGTRPASFT
jgi:hypothetical protein